MTTRRNFIGAFTGILTVLPFVKIKVRPDENEENIRIWTTADWRSIRIVDLEDDHLRNIIFFIREYGVPKRNIWRDRVAMDTIDALHNEAKRRNLSIVT